MNPNVSIIVPVYKACLTIEKCLLSLLHQSLGNIELIVVDDKGNDGSLDVVKKIQQAHDRGHCIKILEMPENLGAALARNKALELATGEYVAFVDSDDWCESDMYADLFGKAKITNADFCYCQAKKDLAGGKTLILKQKYSFSGSVSNEMRKIMLTNFVAYFWAGIYKRTFLQENNIAFPKGKYSEDSYFVWLNVLYANRVASVDRPYYHYIMNAASVTASIDAQRYLKKIELYFSFLEDVKSRNLYSKQRSEIDYLIFKKGILLPMMIYTLESPEFNSSKIFEINNLLKKRLPDINKNVFYLKNIKIRILYNLFISYPDIVAKIIKLSFFKNKINL
jgi:glycosyltransferase involved in cell wall biosynthesis